MYLLDGFEVGVGLENCRWWSGEGSSPDLNLIGSELFDGLLLVLAGQITVVTLVQTPGIVDWNVLLTKSLEDRVAGLVGSLQERSVRSVELVVSVY